MGFINCRGWWSREVDVRLMLLDKGLDVLGLAEIFLREDQEVDVGGLCLVWDEQSLWEEGEWWCGVVGEEWVGFMFTL